MHFPFVAADINDVIAAGLDWALALPGSAVNNQLLFEQPVLRHDCATTAWLNQFGYRREQVIQQVNDVFHAVRV